MILNCAGPQVLKVYDNIVCENAEDKVLEALENYCNPRHREVLESHRWHGTVHVEVHA